MAIKNYLDTAGVKRLWRNIVNAIRSSVDAESNRAKAEEKRIEEKITQMGSNAYAEGEGINITENENGQKVISLEQNSISGDHIKSVPASKITIEDGEILVLNGGSIDE
jgi:hypothetical protein